MNKENVHPNLHILQQREAHLSVSRSIPSIFRRRKRARSAHPELSHHQDPAKLKHAQPPVGTCTTPPSTETIYPHERPKLQCNRQSTDYKCNSRALPDHHQPHAKLNREDHSVSPQQLTKSENQDDTNSQKFEACTIKTNQDGLVRAQLNVRRDATGTNDDGNRDSQNFEDISNEIALEPDHSRPQRKRVALGFTVSPSQCQSVTEK